MRTTFFAFISCCTVAATVSAVQTRTSGSSINDRVTRLGKQIEQGEVELEFHPDGRGYLPSLLEHLDLNIDSQVLVFSKTSFQQELINPKNARALYFNDDVSVGSVPGGEVFEMTALDPGFGIVYYTLSTHKSDKPRLERRGSECLSCHGPVNQYASGLIVATVFPDVNGTPVFTGSFFTITDHRTPFDERWGGWYVTGTHGSQEHRGNAVAPDHDRPLDLQTAGTQNVTSLAKKLDTTKYLAPTSDIVALLTLEHQTGMTNLITSVGGRFRHGAASLDAGIEELVTYMLFADEEPLREPVKGVSTFTQTFPQRGPRDKQGRSLRDFDLQKRLFRHPLSYMIYSEVFEGLPDAVREKIYRRLYDVLTGKDTSKKYSALSAVDRRAVLEILRDTKPNLPAYWKSE
ncbi:MAG TPA: hypothetical protein VE422_21005 [Terriglobia bacterium]|nr:hypothetical protein [Terriglobia bacterium]